MNLVRYFVFAPLFIAGCGVNELPETQGTRVAEAPAVTPKPPTPTSTPITIQSNEAPPPPAFGGVNNAAPIQSGPSSQAIGFTEEELSYINQRSRIIDRASAAVNKGVNPNDSSFSATKAEINALWGECLSLRVPRRFNVENQYLVEGISTLDKMYTSTSLWHSASHQYPDVKKDAQKAIEYFTLSIEEMKRQGVR